MEPENGVPLCPTCHSQFDFAADPGFVFIPTDLQYFIQFELEDRKRRSAATPEKWAISRRKVPTADMYRTHQMEKGIIPNDAKGGLYLPVFLKSYLHKDALPYDLTPYFSHPKQWHGAPLASIRRAIPILGSARIKALSPQMCRELEKLRDLYFLNDEEDSTSKTQPDNQERKRYHDVTTQDDLGSPKKKLKDSVGANAEQGNKDRSRQDPGPTEQCFASDWTLGPDVSTEEAVRRFAPICARSLEFFGV